MSNAQRLDLVFDDALNRLLQRLLELSDADSSNGVLGEALFNQRLGVKMRLTGAGREKKSSVPVLDCSWRWPLHPQQAVQVSQQYYARDAGGFVKWRGVDEGDVAEHAATDGML